MTLAIVFSRNEDTLRVETFPVQAPHVIEAMHAKGWTIKAIGPVSDD